MRAYCIERLDYVTLQHTLFIFIEPCQRANEGLGNYFPFLTIIGSKAVSTMLT